MDAGNGDGDHALEAACVAHQAMLLHHARNFLGNRRDDAPDFVQDTIVRFVVAFRSKPPPREPGCGGWLMTTLTNLLISDWRKQGVRRAAMSDPVIHMIAGPQQVVSLDSVRPLSATDRALDELSNEDFKEAVNALSEKLRAAYELHVLGLRHQEIADRLGISAVAARKRLHDARRQLAERLELGPSEEAS